MNVNEFSCCSGTQRILEDTHFELLLLALGLQASVILLLLACERWLETGCFSGTLGSVSGQMPTKYTG